MIKSNILIPHININLIKLDIATSRTAGAKIHGQKRSCLYVPLGDPPKAVQNFWDTKVTEPRALYDEVESLHMHEALVVVVFLQ